MKFGPVPVNEATGMVLAHSVQLDNNRRIKKGKILKDEDIEALANAGRTSVTVASLSADDISEDVAAEQLAAALCSADIRTSCVGTGRVNLHAAKNGIFRANRSIVDQVNAIDPATTIATLNDYVSVTAGQMIGTVKIIPYAVQKTLVDKAAETAKEGAISLHPFSAMKVGLVSTCLSSLKISVMDKTLGVLKTRLSKSGSIITREIRCTHDEREVADAIQAQLDGNELLILFGASAISDENDVLPNAVRLAGGSVTRFGMPVDPGNLILLGEVDGKPVIGAPGCARSPAENGFDWVLDRILARIPVSSEDISKMGVGGLLKEIGSRPRPRELAIGHEIEVSAIILAAGQSRRMGKSNKLLAILDETPLVLSVSQAVLNSSVERAIAVTGHEAEAVSSILPEEILVRHNPDFASGLSSSLATGISAVPEYSSHAVILLGDMPQITSGMIDQMIEAAKTAPANAIIMASNNGKRGNPVIWPRVYFEALKSISGDVGARHLIEANREQVVEVELGEAASFDLDTPEALERAGGELSE